jgi:hypothetical protein
VTARQWLVAGASIYLLSVAMGIAAAFDFNVWQWAETALPMGE